MSSRVDTWTCERCRRDIRVIRCDPDWQYGENICPDDGQWQYVDGRFVCPNCLTREEARELEAQPNF